MKTYGMFANVSDQKSWHEKFLDSYHTGIRLLTDKLQIGTLSN